MTMRQASIPIYGRGGMVRAWVEVDPEDFHRIAAWRWHIGTNGYPIRTETVDGRRRVIQLHREVIGAPDDMLVDHISGDKLDARRSNLRLATAAENAQNRASRPGSTSTYRGVTWDRRKGKWMVVHTLNNVRRFGGYFDDEHEAGRVASAWRSEYMPFAVAR